MRNNKSNKGFTLIELLIVIAIIGILAAVLIPNLMGARTSAAQRAAQAHSSSVYTALVAALAADTQAVSSDFTGTDCQAGGAIPGTDFSVNAAPAGTTCSIAADGNDDFNVTVTHTASSMSFINGIQQGTGTGAGDGDADGG